MKRALDLVQYWKNHIILLIISLTALFFVAHSVQFDHPQFHLNAHIILETFSITISFMIFYLGLSTYDERRPGNFYILSALFLSVGWIELAHMMSYEGMNDFFTANTTNKAILFGQAARILTAFCLLIFTVTYVKPVRMRWARSAYMAFSILFTAFIFLAVIRYEHIWPATYIPGEGMTPFKIAADYFILALHAVNLIWIVASAHVRSGQFVQFNSRNMAAAISLLIVSEIAFTIYQSASDMVNAAGHVFKAIGVAYIFKAIFHETVRQPLVRLIHSEQKLRDSSDRMLAILENIHDSVVIANGKGNVTFMNFSAEAWTGMTAKEAFGISLSSLFRTKNPLEISPAGNREVKRDTVYTPQGEIAEVEYCATRLVSATSEITIVLMFSDITERVRADKEKDQLLTVLESTKDFIGIADGEGKLKYYNKAAREILGIKQEDIHKLAITDTHPKNAAYQLLKEAFPEAIAKGVWRGESLLLSHTGRQVPVSIIIASHKNAQGEVEYFSAIMRDITDWKNAEEKNLLAQKVFASIGEGIVVADVRKIIIDVNRAFSDLLGYTAEEVIGCSLNMLGGERNLPEIYKEMWSSVDQTGIWRGEIWSKRKDDTPIIIELTFTTVRDNCGKILHYVGTFKDITMRKEMESKIRFQAYHDSLTGLPNRIMLQERLSQAIDHAEKNKTKIGVMFIDLDRFKRINDHLGHHVGDQLLKEVAERLKKSLRDIDTVARIGGDELVVIRPDWDEQKDHLLAEKIRDQIASSYRIEEHEIYVTCSIGISLYPKDSKDPDTLVRLADLAMYKAKKSGRNRYQFYHEVQSFNDNAFPLEKLLRKAFESDLHEQFEVYYQPIVRTDELKIVGAEALIRWNHSEKGQIAPAKFIPVAEETGLILAIDRWVLRQACKQMKAWQQSG